MSDKMECPGCTSYTSSVLAAVRDGYPCPYCGLSALTIEEVNAVREYRANEELKEAMAAALIRAERAEAERDELRSRLEMRNVIA